MRTPTEIINVNELADDSIGADMIRSASAKNTTQNGTVSQERRRGARKGKPPKSKISDLIFKDRIKLCWDRSRQKFWTETTDGTWQLIPEALLRTRLKDRGLRASVDKTQGEIISPLDAKLQKAFDEHGVDYAGPLAGHFKGPKPVSGVPVLVTNSPNLIKPKPGDWKIIEQILINMLGPEQIKYFHAWMKVAFESLRDGTFIAGQAMIFVGKSSCGKSFTQKYIITPILGGRMAKPFRYMSGQTTFNGDLIGAEHQCIEDEQSRFTMPQRLAYAAAIKTFCVTSDQSCHLKHRDAVTLQVQMRLTQSLNNEGENINGLPQMDDSIKDKLMLFLCEAQKMPMDTSTLAAQAKLRAVVDSQLPHYVDFLENYEIPEEMRDDRYLVEAYQHPQLLEDLKQSEYHLRLLEIIDLFLASDHTLKEWEGSAADLYNRLVNDKIVGYQAKQLLGWSTSSITTYLAKLKSSHKDRVMHNHTRNGNIWVIKRASVEEV